MIDAAEHPANTKQTMAPYLAMNQTPAGPNHSFFYGPVNTTSRS